MKTQMKAQIKIVEKPQKKPKKKPKDARFSSGPCKKYPSWNIKKLDNFLGRSARTKQGRAILKNVVELTAEILQVPNNYRLAIVPASATGAMEMALWSLLGARGVNVLAWEKFGHEWLYDICHQLKIKNAKVFTAPCGSIVDFTKVDFDCDVVFTWNGTPCGTMIPNGDFIPHNRGGLTICDATSAAFAQNLPFEKLDVTIFSWQKVLGGEAGYGMIILSPRAIERLETYTPPWPVPKIFRLAKNKKLLPDIFAGATINTPSMLCVGDYLCALQWAKSIGGLPSLIKRTNDNFAIIENWVAKTAWIDFLAKVPNTRSTTSVCLVFTDEDFLTLTDKQQQQFVECFVELLAKNKAAYDIVSHRHSCLGLRIWCGATIEKDDLIILTKWLDWAFNEIK